MAELITQQDAIKTILDTIIEQGEIATDADLFAEGILGGLLVGFGMDDTAFLSVHGPRLAHLTRQALTFTGRDVKPQIGARPRNI